MPTKPSAFTIRTMRVPFFSVVIPTYNRLSFLENAVDSVLGQTFDDFELVIVDDGSTDGTEDLVAGIRDPRVVYTRHEHRGVSISRNRGVMSSMGKAIAFLDSDDRFLENKLEVTFDYMKKFPRFEIFHSEEIWYRNKVLLPQKAHHRKPDGYVFDRALLLCCISISTAVIKRDVFDKVGMFDEDLPACEDYDFWLRTTFAYPVKLIPQALTIKDGGHPDQLSRQYPAMDRFRIYSIKKMLDSGQLDEESRRLAAAELKHKCSIYLKGAAKRNKVEEVAFYRRIADSC